MEVRDIFMAKVPKWKRDPVMFSRDVLNFTPDDWQADSMIHLRERSRVAIKSGQGVGKTSIEACCLLWFLACHPYSRVVATAPTQHQLSDILWAEVSKWLSRSPLLTRMLKFTKSRIFVRGCEERWFAVAQTATKPESMQGFHADNMLFIIDEASGVADPIMEAIFGTLSGINNKLLMMGNPTQTTGAFHDAFVTDRALYYCRTVSSRDSKRTNKENIESLIRKYGEDSNVVRVRVDGEFPLVDDDVFIPLQLIEKSIRTEYEPRRKPEQIHIGCDVARYGDDKTVIGFRVDEKCEFFRIRNGQDTMKTADDIALLGLSLADRYNLKSDPGSCIFVKIDDGGVGGGVTDRLRQLKRNNPQQFSWMEIYPVQFGKKINHKYYDDSTTYMMAQLRNLLQPYDDDGNPKPVEIILPDDTNMVAQLSSRKYELTERGKIRIESKKAVKARGNPSPDEGDCVLLLCLPVSRPKRRKGVNI